MFGPKLSQIFRSRWAALWWAALMLFLAWQMVPAPDDSPSAEATASAAANPWLLPGTGSSEDARQGR